MGNLRLYRGVVLGGGTGVARMIPNPTTAGEYRANMLTARRWANVCLDAGELDEAKRLIAEAARFDRIATEIQNDRKEAA